VWSETRRQPGVARSVTAEAESEGYAGTRPDLESRLRRSSRRAFLQRSAAQIGIFLEGLVD